MLEVPVEVGEETLEALAGELLRNEDEERLDRLMDQRRRLASIRRDWRFLTLPRSSIPLRRPP